MNARRVTTAVRCWGETAYRWSTRIVFPETCAGCEISGTWMCAHCAQRIPRLASVEHVLTLQHPEAGTSTVAFRIAAACQFGGPARRAIHLLKYHGQSARAEWCAAEIAEQLGVHARSGSLLVPVPLYHKRQQRRGFNQSAQIAVHLSAHWNCKHADALVRVRETRPQVELSGVERLENVRGAFQASTRLDGRDVILVDDVVTTGATLRECAMVCLSAGASSVSAAVVAGSVPGQAQSP